MCKRFLSLGVAFIGVLAIMKGQGGSSENTNFKPRTYAQAGSMADSVLALMTLDEKISYVGGDKSFFIRGIPRLRLREVEMSDATEGVRMRDGDEVSEDSKPHLKESTAFPCPIELAATWDPALAYQYARAIGEECRAGNIGILLGPGLNEYRISQCGRNFEYFGEDPLLRARMIEKYVEGVQSTGTAATLKHFVANNTEFFRRRSNSIVDERALHEIYLPGFKAGIDAGAKAVMTSYNQLDGEWCGQSPYVVSDLLRRQLGFKWLVMTDWRSVYDGQKVATSGQNLEMPSALALKDAKRLIDEGKIQVADIDSMVINILRTYFAMRFDERQPETFDPEQFKAHERVALQTAREGIVLLKNAGHILPLKKGPKSILLTGTYVDSLASGGGSAHVQGYDIHLMIDEMKKQFGNRLTFVKNPTVKQIRVAGVVLCNVGTHDSEGNDRPFALPEDQERLVRKCVEYSPNTVVIVTSGGGVRMTDWNQKAKAIVYAWYGGQIGNQALAEIIAGEVNPSGKLPITIEKDFKDSPGYGYMPEGESLYSRGNGKAEAEHSVYDVKYKEGIFVGYRWYDKKNIKPLYPFGHGLSYTKFEYGDMGVTRPVIDHRDVLGVTFFVKNVGNQAGTEVVQLYVHEENASVPRPPKELKGFARVELKPGERKYVTIDLHNHDFAFWNPKTKSWTAEKGKYTILVGSSSNDIRLKTTIVLIN
jgi:beta-glucosidase